MFLVRKTFRNRYLNAINPDVGRMPILDDIDYEYVMMMNLICYPAAAWERGSAAFHP